MKIIVVGPRNLFSKTESGGIEIYTKNLYHEILKINQVFEVIIYNLSNNHQENDFIYEGLFIKNIYIDKIFPKIFEKYIFSFIVFYKTIFSKFNIIHFHGLSVCWFVPFYRIIRRNVFYTNHSNDFLFKKNLPRYVFSNILKFFSKFSNITLSHSNHYQHSNYILPIVSADLDIINPKIQKLKKKYILFGGRFTKDKGAQRFLNFALLFPDIQFYICGSLTKSEFKFSENVSYLGNFKQDEFFYLIKNSLAVISPSHHEQMDMVFHESIKLKVKVIASNIDAHKFKNQNVLIIDFHKININKVVSFLNKPAYSNYKHNIVGFEFLAKKYINIYEDFYKK